MYKANCIEKSNWCTVNEDDCDSIVIKPTRRKKKCKEVEEKIPVRIVVENLQFLDCEEDRDSDFSCVPDCNVDLTIDDAVDYKCPPSVLNDICYRFNLPTKGDCKKCIDKTTNIHAMITVTGIETAVGDAELRIYSGAKLIVEDPLNGQVTPGGRYEFIGELEDVDLTLPLFVRFYYTGVPQIGIREVSINLLVEGKP